MKGFTPYIEELPRGDPKTDPQLSSPFLGIYNDQKKAKKMQIMSRGKHTADTGPRHRAYPFEDPARAGSGKGVSLGSSAAYDFDNPGVISPKREVNSCWNPCHDADDVTVHLRMSVQEDLDDSLEEFCRLQRLGDFISARRFFMEILQDYIYKPIIRMEYAEMLLEQGDYNALSAVDGSTVCYAEDNDGDNSHGRLLRSYWKLMQVLIACHKPGNVSHDYNAIMNETFFNLDIIRHVITTEKREITSTEIKMLAMANRLALYQERLDGLFSSQFYRSLYLILLRHGSIWDLYDISVARMTNPNLDVSQDWIDDPSPRKRIQTLIKDWSSAIKGYDTSTTLALLSILGSYIQDRSTDFDEEDSEFIEYVIDQSTLLAISVMENDPDSMRSRPFVKWMLAKSYSKNTGQLHLQLGCLRSSPGTMFHGKGYVLPGYVPLKIENPGWKVDQAAPDIEASVKMAIKTSHILGDYQTEVTAHQLLIIFSANPAQQFEELGNIQKKTQGDILNYAKTLISKYLICDTEASRNDLKKEISELLSIPLLHTYIGHLQGWALWMLQHALESDESGAKRALHEADIMFDGLDGVNRELIDQKFYTKHRLSPKNTKLRTPSFYEVESQAIVKRPNASMSKETAGMGSEKANIGPKTDWREVIHKPIMTMESTEDLGEYGTKVQTPTLQFE
ncbi:hypothetical protein F5Y00DRAFT_272547 [Daldinia vernicosa]|uniref:uncharacterized protein n=1 Tax=Daldinia vernicosa TaxID=114800 RepID=UPI002007691E|nr:uncharacterized protein F5Y00DRAFT_272547 [Daldinia vernicosa]KAI0853001.1 hypothetical protein F5Y00DRAFT_272547 [Daldinia vernicosa]